MIIFFSFSLLYYFQLTGYVESPAAAYGDVIRRKTGMYDDFLLGYI